MDEDTTTEQVESGDDTLFYSSYMQINDPLVVSVRREAFGEDIGQFGWTTADEMRHFFELLQLGPQSRVLDVACGSGGPTLFMARSTGCSATGVDITYSGIHSAGETAAALDLASRATFQQVDAGGPLPFDDGSFDAVTCIDAIDHFQDRVSLFKEWYRVLRPGGRILFTDPIVVTGLLERQEMIHRSRSMGIFLFTPPGLNERFIETAGFETPRVEDVTGNIVQVSRQWRQARENHAPGLVEVEGQKTFESFQHFLDVVNTLASEGRLSRFLYVARKPA
jgi:cyclopropane fatty-acyl-phospholipid synthase-like methyltransferase